MATVQVAQTDTFENWRLKTNQLSSNVGDLALLVTTSKGTTIEAINEVKQEKADLSYTNTLVGNKNDLATTAKTNIVAAINEVKLATGGDLTTLTTTNKSSIIAALNEVNANVGQPSILLTTTKTSTVAAINELFSFIGTVDSKTTPVLQGGTGATTASGARTNLGLGTISTQNANAVSITGGSVSTSTLSGVIPKANIHATTFANSLAGLDSTNTALEYKQLVAGTNFEIIHSLNSITFNSIAGTTIENANKLTTARNITMTGDVSWVVSFDGSANVSASGSLSATGVSAGTYQSVTVDTKGRISAASALDSSMIPNLNWSKITTGKPTSLAGYGIIDTAFNKVTITAPATSATLTIADGKTLSCSNTLTFTGTDSSSVAFGTGGTVTYTTSKLSVFAATTSAELLGVISDETGSGALVFGTSPAITTSLTTGSTTFALVNTTATTVNFAGAATTLSIGAGTGTTTINNALVATSFATAQDRKSVASTTTTSTTPTTVSTFATASYRSGSFEIQVVSGVNYTRTNINVIHDGTNVTISEHGTAVIGSALGTFDASITTGNLNLVFTAASSTSTVIKVIQRVIAV